MALEGNRKLYLLPQGQSVALYTLKNLKTVISIVNISQSWIAVKTDAQRLNANFWFNLEFNPLAETSV
jgi:hypothetical protein